MCRECARRPAHERRAIEEWQEIEGFLRQSHISAKNVHRLRVLCSEGTPENRTYAARVLEIALVAPNKRKRSRVLKRYRADRWRALRGQRDCEIDFEEGFGFDDTEKDAMEPGTSADPPQDLWVGQDTPEDLDGAYSNLELWTP